MKKTITILLCLFAMLLTLFSGCAAKEPDTSLSAILSEIREKTGITDGLVLTDADKYLIAQLICMEAASEPFEGQQAVAEVVLNRLASGRFQSSVHNVIHAPGQFASVSRLHKAEPDYTQYKAIEQAQYGPYVLDEDVVFFGKFKMNDNFWGQIGSHYFCYSY